MTTTPPLSTAPLHFVFPAIRKELLGNGTPVYLIERADEDLMSITLNIASGAVHDELDGETSFTAAMLVRGTTTMSPEDFAEEVERRGCSIGSSSDRDSTSIVATGLSEYDRDLVRFLSDSICSPGFDTVEIERQLKRRIGDHLQNVADPDWLAGQALSVAAFDGHPYGRPKDGTPETMTLVDRARMQAVYTRLLTYPRFVIVSGRFDSETVLRDLDEGIGRLPAPMAVSSIARASLRSRVAAIASKDDAVQTVLRIALPSLPLVDPDYTTLFLLTEILGGFTMARLFAVLRERKGYTYGAYAYLENRKWSEAIRIMTSVGNGFTADTVATIKTELERMRGERIGDEEFENTRQHALGRFARSNETPQQTAGLLWMIISNDLPMDYFERHIERLQALTPDDVRRVQERFFDPATLTIGASGDRSVIVDAVADSVDTVIDYHA